MRQPRATTACGAFPTDLGHEQFADDLRAKLPWGRGKRWIRELWQARPLRWEFRVSRGALKHTGDGEPGPWATASDWKESTSQASHTESNDFEALLSGRKVAVVHDWLVTFAGSETVLAEILRLIPGADLFSLIDYLPPDKREFVSQRKITTTFLQSIPGGRKYYRQMLPLMPLAIESLDVSAYDVVISSSHAVAKGILTGPEQLHLCYCHTPMRYAWDLQHQYLSETGGSRGLRQLAATALLQYLRMWDLRTANAVDAYVANSRYIARRLEKLYRRSASVIHPPVDTEFYVPGGAKREYYLTVGRLVPYKRVDAIVAAFAQLPGHELIVVGTGPEEAKCKTVAGANVTFTHSLSREELRRLMQEARGFVYAAKEDFGIVMAEALACGTPVIAYGEGGARDIVCDRSGVFFHEQSPEAIAGAIRSFELTRHDLTVEGVRTRAEQFSYAVFRDRFYKELQTQLYAS